MRSFVPSVFLGLLMVQGTLALPAQRTPPAFDANSPLESRVMETPQVVFDTLTKGYMRMPTRHPLSQAERAKVLADLARLPDFERHALQQHVRSISFVDGLPMNGLTVLDNPAMPGAADILIQTTVLNETISQFLTRKERSCYQPPEAMELSVEAGSLDATLYVLLHESMHVVDMMATSATTQDSPPVLAMGYWQTNRIRSAPYDSDLLGQPCFFSRSPLSMDTAQAIYSALGNSPFVSLYATTNWSDDSAELVAMYHLTHVLRQPYRIVLRRGQQITLSPSPMESPRVMARFPAVQALYP